MEPVQIMPSFAHNVVTDHESEHGHAIGGSTLALTIGVLELTGQSRQIESATFQGIEALTAATATYVALTTVVIVLMRAAERRVVLPGTLGAA